jgi:hypothetical protein
LLVVFFLCAAVTGLVAASAILGKTPGVPVPPYGPLPPTGGLPAESLSLRGKLAHDNGVYTIEVDALPGYVVPLSLSTSDLETWAAANLGQDVTVSGHWDKANPTVFVVQSAILS